MKPSMLIFIPLLFLGEILLFNTIVDLLRQPSDITVLIGTFLSGLFILLNYYLINFIIKQLKKQKLKK